MDRDVFVQYLLIFILKNCIYITIKNRIRTVSVDIYLEKSKDYYKKNLRIRTVSVDIYHDMWQNHSKDYRLYSYSICWYLSPEFGQVRIIVEDVFVQYLLIFILTEFVKKGDCIAYSYSICWYLSVYKSFRQIKN